MAAMGTEENVRHGVVKKRREPKPTGKGRRNRRDSRLKKGEPMSDTPNPGDAAVITPPRHSQENIVYWCVETIMITELPKDGPSSAAIICFRLAPTRSPAASNSAKTLKGITTSKIATNNAPPADGAHARGHDQSSCAPSH